VEYRLNITDLQNPNDILALKKAISEIASDCDVLYSGTAPDGNISARVGRRCCYNNGGTYTFWQNVDGDKSWRQITDSANDMWIIDGTETQLRTADEIDMQSKKIINVTDPAADQDASTKKYVDGKFDVSTGHDHDGSDSKKITSSGITAAFGSWDTSSYLANGTEYTAATDGFLVAQVFAGTTSRVTMAIFTPVATSRASIVANKGGAGEERMDTHENAVLVPVRKGDTFKATVYVYIGSGNGTLQWIPLGS
jgi:hypothetical protein